MCGLVGLLAPDVTQAHLEQANNQLTHRGPDDAGYFIGEGVGLAARRLSIIDLHGGHQPLSNEDGTLWIAYNGEIMNAPQLRQELRAAGHRFQTASDTEVIVHGFEEWGEALLTRLRGMFTFALWDTRRHRLLLARDRFGIKPLYYAQTGSNIAFGSEIKPIFKLLPSLPRQVNHLALQQLFRWGFIQSPQTAVSNIYKLPAAHLMWVDAEGCVEKRPYWQLSYATPDNYLSISRDEAVEQFMHHLRDAVGAWRLSDVPVGSLLSGGVDSGALAALLTEIGGKPIHTFNIGFEAASHDETAVAQATATAIGSHHHTLTFTNGDFDYLPQVIGHLEEPQCSATSIPIYLLYRACHNAGFKVILTGEGADELLGGYHWFDGDRRIRPLLKIPQPLRAALARLPLPVSTAGKRVLAHGNADPISRFALWHQVAEPALVRQLLDNQQSIANNQQLTTPILNSPFSILHSLNQFLHMETTTRMVDFINFEVDRMSMANSVEARPPFLDHRLWEFCVQLPPEYKLTPQINKYLLRKGMQNRLPSIVQQRPKQGLSTPHAAWWRQEKLPNWAEDCLHGAALEETAVFHPHTVAQLRQQHQTGKSDHSRILMGILTTQLWLQEFIL